MLFAITLGSLLGSTGLHLYTVWPPKAYVLYSLGLLGCLCALLGVKCRLRPLKWSLVFILSVILGWSWTYYQVLRKQACLSQSTLPVNGVLSGMITRATILSQEGVQFDLKTNEGCGVFRLYWKSPSVKLYDQDKIRVKVNVRQPWSTQNPGGADKDKYYFIQNIVGTGYVTQLLSHESTQKHSLQRWRQRWAEKIAEQLDYKSHVGVIQAMTVGMTSSITPAQWRVFQATGTSHAVAISGLHIGLVALLCAWLTTSIIKRFYRLTSWAPAMAYGQLSALLGALMYSACAGFAIPTQRACIMIVVFTLTQWRRQHLLSWEALAWAWLVMGIIDPFVPLAKGFWLSFGCVGALLLGRSHYVHAKGVLQWFMPQTVVFFALIPLSILFFNQISLVSILANAFFIPVVSFIIVPFSLLGLIGGKIFLKIAYISLSWSWIILEKLANLSWSVIYLSKLTVPMLIVGSMGVFILLLPKGLPGRYIAWYALLPLFFTQHEKLPFGICRFTLLDVGQGLAAVVSTRNHTLLFDAGPAYAESDVGKTIIEPYLRYEGITTLDKIIISHSDLDHRGGLQTLQYFPYNDLMTSEPHRLLLPSRRCVANETWEWDGVQFTMLHPSTSYRKRNNQSCVLKVTAKGQSVLITGDIETQAEGDIINRYEAGLKSDLLVVPHHGSLTSSSPSFIESVSPQYALFPVGKDNRYAFPRDAIWRRYQALGIHCLMTWQTGAIMFELGRQEELTPPIQWRDTLYHYWTQTSTKGV